jgi:hypothetical protein
MTLNAESVLSAHGQSFSGDEVHLLRKRRSVPTVKINGTEHNPLQWLDGNIFRSRSRCGTSISKQTVFKWLQKGRLSGPQLAKGMPADHTFEPADRRVKNSGDRREGHHESFESPNTLGHSANARLIVTMIAVRL